jgi:hypothetical protein|tara:strand:- start:399 stop:587 length:189 start_codon:yes stop_codon:yes gene_type:complete
MTDTIDQLRELGLTIYVICKGYADGDTHAHLLTSSCKPTKITRLHLFDREQVKSIDLDFEVK